MMINDDDHHHHACSRPWTHRGTRASEFADIGQWMDEKSIIIHLHKIHVLEMKNSSG